MSRKVSAGRTGPKCPGLFVVGSDTGVGKTYAAARIAAALVGAGVRVGVYKPAASGCSRVGDELVSEDALALWEAAGKPLSLAAVCPQRFAAPLAPHLAAIGEGQALDGTLLRSGIEPWVKASELVIVEGAGGLLSPLGEQEDVASVAADFGFPLVVVVPNRIGAINACLLTLSAARVRSLAVAAVVLNDVAPDAGDDPSRANNAEEIAKRCEAPLVRLGYRAHAFEREVDWRNLAGVA